MKKLVEIFNNNKRVGYLIRRCFAFSIDWYIVAVLGNFLVMFLSMIIKKEMLNLSLVDYSLFISVISILVVSLFYYVIVPVYIWNGQTFMYSAMQIRVIRVNNDTLTFKTMMKRFWIGCVLLQGSFYFVSTILLNAILLKLFPNNLNSADLIIGGIVMIMSVSSLIIGYKDKQDTKLFHDIISKTVVVDIKKIS